MPPPHTRITSGQSGVAVLFLRPGVVFAVLSFTKIYYRLLHSFEAHTAENLAMLYDYVIYPAIRGLTKNLTPKQGSHCQTC